LQVIGDPSMFLLDPKSPLPMTHPANPARTPGLHRARLVRYTYHDFFKNPVWDEDALEQTFQ
jgi:hypothetical protein